MRSRLPQPPSRAEEPRPGRGAPPLPRRAVRVPTSHRTRWGDDCRRTRFPPPVTASLTRDPDRGRPVAQAPGANALGAAQATLCRSEGCRSGRTGRSRKPLGVQASRGFKSLPLRCTGLRGARSLTRIELVGLATRAPVRPPVRIAQAARLDRCGAAGTRPVRPPVDGPARALSRDRGAHRLLRPPENRGDLVVRHVEKPSPGRGASVPERLGEPHVPDTRDEPLVEERLAHETCRLRVPQTGDDVLDRRRVGQQVGTEPRAPRAARA